MWWERFARSLQCVASCTSCARRPRGVRRLRSLMVLSTHGSGRARGEREEQKAWAVAQSLQCVVSSTSCARRPRGVVRLRSPMVLSTHRSGDGGTQFFFVFFLKKISTASNGCDEWRSAKAKVRCLSTLVMLTAPSCWLSASRGLEPTIENARVASAKLQQIEDRCERVVDVQRK